MRGPQDVFVDRGDVPGRGAVGDQAAPRGVEDRGLAGGEHGGQRDVRVRVLARPPQLALGVDDVALELGPALGVVVAREQAAGEQAVQFGLGAAGANQDRAAFLGELVLVRRRRRRARSGTRGTAAPA